MPETPTDEPTLDEVTYDFVPVPVFDSDPADPPRFCVVRNDLVATLADGELRVPLRVPWRLIGLLAGKEPREQLYIVLRDRGESSPWRRFFGWRKGRDLVRRIENLDVTDSRELVRKFWQAIGEREEARLGESLRSTAQSGSTEQH